MLTDGRDRVLLDALSLTGAVSLPRPLMPVDDAGARTDVVTEGPFDDVLGDMLVAIFSHFFVNNPMSTLSTLVLLVQQAWASTPQSASHELALWWKRHRSGEMSSCGSRRDDAAPASCGHDSASLAEGHLFRPLFVDGHF